MPQQEKSGLAYRLLNKERTFFGRHEKMITILVSHPDLHVAAALKAMIDGIFAEINMNSICILTAGNFEETVSLVRHYPIQLALFDVELLKNSPPGGLANLRLRSMRKVLMMTDSKANPDVWPDTTFGIEILIRPLERKDLKALIHRFLHRGRGSR